MDSPVHVVLIGLMASGKTTVGKRLAAALDRPFVDNDDMLQRRTGHTARDIADHDGEHALHDAETDVLLAALSEPEPAVIGAAAATVLEPDARRALSTHFVAYLEATPDVLARRVEQGTADRTDDGHRPFVAEDPLAVLRTQFRERDPAYRSLATCIVDADRDPDEIAAQITSALERA